MGEAGEASWPRPLLPLLTPHTPCRPLHRPPRYRVQGTRPRRLGRPSFRPPPPAVLSTRTTTFTPSARVGARRASSVREAVGACTVPPSAAAHLWLSSDSTLTARQARLRWARGRRSCSCSLPPTTQTSYLCLARRRTARRCASSTNSVTAAPSSPTLTHILTLAHILTLTLTPTLRWRRLPRAAPRSQPDGPRASLRPSAADCALRRRALGLG